MSSIRSKSLTAKRISTSHFSRTSHVPLTVNGSQNKTTEGLSPCLEEIFSRPPLLRRDPRFKRQSFGLQRTNVSSLYSLKEKEAKSVSWKKKRPASSEKKASDKSVVKETARWPLLRKNFNLSVPKATDEVDKQTCRALQFEQIQEEDEELTKPLPQVDLTFMDMNGSLFPKNTNLINKNPNPASNKDTIDTTVAGRKLVLGVPHVYKRRSSSIPIFNRTVNNKENVCPATSKTSRKQIPQIPRVVGETPRSDNFSNTIVQESSRHTVHVADDGNHGPLSLSSEATAYNKAKYNQKKMRTVASNTSPGPPPNSPAYKQWKLTSTSIKKKESSLVTKDASTNTIISSYLFHPSLLEAEELISNSISKAKKLMDNFQFQCEEMLIEYQKSVEPIRILKERMQTLTFNEDSDQFKGVVPTKEKPVKKETKSNYNYKFLGTPLPNKRLTRCFSSPTLSTHGGDGMNTSDKDGSFHSVDSIVSPFTAYVGDCSRLSALPLMTPASKRYVNGIKMNLKDQMKMLDS